MSSAATDLARIASTLDARNAEPSYELAASLTRSAAQALTQAAHLDEIVLVRDGLRAAEWFFRRQRAQLIESNLLVAQRLRTERHIGELLAGTVTNGRPKMSTASTINRIPDGISRDESSRWQRMAQIDGADFEQWVTECVNSRELSSAGLLRLWAAHKPADGLDDASEVMPLAGPGCAVCGRVEPLAGICESCVGRLS